MHTPAPAHPFEIEAGRQAQPPGGDGHTGARPSRIEAVQGSNQVGAVLDEDGWTRIRWRPPGSVGQGETRGSTHRYAAARLEGQGDKLRGLKLRCDHFHPGRWNQLFSANELAAWCCSQRGAIDGISVSVVMTATMGPYIPAHRTEIEQLPHSNGRNSYSTSHHQSQGTHRYS